MKKKILIVFGTRPEAIKMAPLVLQFQKYPNDFETVVCVTGQHRKMLDQVLTLFEIKPKYDLNIIQPGQDLFDITGNVLMAMRSVLKEVSPDFVFVHGDTTSSVAAALAAFYLHIPVAHVEAGLRTHNNYFPWPEEMNRSITGRLATWHFPATTLAKQNLLDENIRENQIQITGNTVIDALYWVTAKININAAVKEELNALVAKEGYDLGRLDNLRRMVLITGHRRENFGEGISNICQAIKNLALLNPDVDFVYPVHLNPNIQKPVQQILGARTGNTNIFLLNPLEYVPFVYLMGKAYLLLTDSGGIQEEATGLGKPVLVMRDTTERPEAIESGNIQLVGTNRLNIENAVTHLLTDQVVYTSMSIASNLYGDGKASERIVSFIRNL